MTPPVDVLLVCMPFGPVFSPSLGLSLLKASLSRHGIPASVRYFSIPFAERIGQHFYSGIASEGRPSVVDMAGEWIFSAALGRPAADDQYVERILRGRAATSNRPGAPRVSEATIRRVQSARNHVEPFLAWCLDDIAASRPRVLGLTSLFQQHVASLALARRVKERWPDMVVVLGGANCEGVMGAETVRQFPFVDAVVSGEGEIVFPALVKRIVAAEPLDGLTGVRTPASASREFAFGTFSNAPAIESLDDLPYPDFTDYLAQFEASRFHKRWLPTLPFETSRGCWWGAKHHCTFCGLNGKSMAFRSKSPARAIDELLTLTASRPGADVEVVDTILDMQYFKTFLPELARRRTGITLFYETKANLKKEQVRLLRDAGVTQIQPGIESFSDPVLQMMRKGVTALQNIQLLKWCKELGVTPIWNVLWGFPGEPVEEYARMAALVPDLTHLPPPRSFDGLRLDRFSPNFTDAERLGFTDVRPIESYRYLYPVPEGAIANLAYFFQFSRRDGSEPADAARPLLRALRAWQRRHRHSDLLSIDVNGALLIWDLRRRDGDTLIELSGIDRALYLACDQVTDAATLVAVARTAGATDDSDTQCRLDRLVSLHLVVVDAGRYLALAIPVGEYQPAPHIARRVFRDIRARARTRGGTAIRIEGRLPRPRLDAVHFSAAGDGTVVVRSVPRGPA